MIKDTTQINTCPDCGSTEIVHNSRRDQIVCKDCGLIYEPLSPELEEQFERTHDMEAPRKTTKKTTKKPTKAKKVVKKKK